jgi:serine palmitoyltransferase
MTVTTNGGDALVAKKNSLENATILEKNRGTFKEPPIYSNYDEFEEPSMWVAICTYASFAILIVFGHLRDFLRKRGIEKSHIPMEKGNTVCELHLPMPAAVSSK